jgi:hypothetical protein
MAIEGNFCDIMGFMGKISGLAKIPLGLSMNSVARWEVN